MDKIKKIFSPGHKSDDQTLYGEGDTSSRQTKSDVPAFKDDPLYDSVPGKQGVGHQLMNPNNEKYDEAVYGEPEGTTAGRSTAGVQQDRIGSLQEDPLYDSATTNQGVTRQILNPHNEKYDEDVYDKTAGDDAALGTSGGQSLRPVITVNPSTDSLRSGIVGADVAPPSKLPQPPLSADTMSAGYPNTTSLPDRTATGTTGSHLGRDALVGGGVGAAGAGAYEVNHNHELGAARYHREDETPVPGYVHHTQGPHATDMANRLDPHVAGGSSAGTGQSGLSTAGHDSHLGRDAALLGGTGAAGAGAYETDRSLGGVGSQPPYSGASGYDDQRFDPSATQGGSSSIGYPSSTGGTTGGLSGGQDSRHYGRDAALVGGAGAAGVGAYELGKGSSDATHLGTGATQQPLATPTGAPSDARIFDQTQTVPQSSQTSAGWATDARSQDKLGKEERHHHHHKHHDDDKEEKKGGILGFIKPHKSHDTTQEKELKQQGNYYEADQAAHQRHQRELERDAAAGTTGIAGAGFEPSLRHQQEYPVENSPQTGVATDASGHNRLHKDPPANVRRELDERARGEHVDESKVGTGEDYYVTDPRTGLKMNVGKYGSGEGGTDAGPIHGYEGQQ